ncbi:hypothetical protein [Reichenbachiella sp.]|uniref:hypothetical protein n=1 Tax=Reichenbachiella sp. TaxID=2184521 RepID=UPI003BB1D4B3
MKNLIAFTFFILSTTVVLAQEKIKLVQLDPVNKNDILTEGNAIIYGNFIQRLGFSSGGFPQDMRVYNKATDTYYRFRVKATMTSKKESNFVFHIPPGDYEIFQYWWTQSNAFGGTFYTEPVFKHTDSYEETITMLESGQLKEEELERFKFIIEPNSVNYLGTWNFDKEVAVFTNDKKSIDQKLIKKYKKISLQNSTINIPQ